MERFPELAKMFSLSSKKDIPEDLPEHLKADFEILSTKLNIPTAKENGKLFHSLYNPLRESEQAAKVAKSSSEDIYSTAFLSCGLGYTAISYANLFPNDTIIIIEPDPKYFFTALSLVDWTPLFSHKNFVIALAAGIDSVVSLIENCGGIKHTAISENQAQSEHARDYFSALRSLIERNKKKVEINASTLEKFSKLWLRNTCKNINFLNELDGINLFKDSCPSDLPVLILAAGPSLKDILPCLSELKKRSILIAVDTALRACLSVKVQPDFVVLTDPQYYAFRHIAGLSSPESILLTESAAYPATFRFDCKKIILCASLFPLGSYIESKIGSKGKLVAGGSVSTTAWDFARYIGSKKIFFAGLDLGFPGFQTHIKGSTFEEAIHASSKRLSTAECKTAGVLFGGAMQTEKDYDRNKILTDSKMKMFAWWFESKCEEFKDSIKTYSLSSKSLRIPGITVADVSEILSEGEKTAEKKEFFENAEKKSESMKKNQGETKELFGKAVKNLSQGLSELYANAKKGIQIAEKGILSPRPLDFIPQIQKIDNLILNSEYKEIASLVFPTERKLSELMKNLPPMNDEIKSSLQKSRLIYKELMQGIKEYKKYL